MGKGRRGIGSSDEERGHEERMGMKNGEGEKDCKREERD